MAGHEIDSLKHRCIFRLNFGAGAALFLDGITTLSHIAGRAADQHRPASMPKALQLAAALNRVQDSVRAALFF